MKAFLKRKDNSAEKLFLISVVSYIVYMFFRIMQENISLSWLTDSFASEGSTFVIAVISIFCLLKEKDFSKYIIIGAVIMSLLNLTTVFNEYGSEFDFFEMPFYRNLIVFQLLMLMYVLFENIKVWCSKIEIKPVIMLIFVIVLFVLSSIVLETLSQIDTGYYPMSSYMKPHFSVLIIFYSRFCSYFFFFLGAALYYYEVYIGIRNIKKSKSKEKRYNEKITEIDKLLSLEIISKEEAERRKNDIADL